VLGASLNYLIGRNIAGLAHRRWFPLSRSAMEQAAAWFGRHGAWALALCWLPTYGDAITVVAGLLRAKFWTFLTFVAAGKLFGHLAVASGITWLT